MALGDPYASVPDVKSRLNINVATFDAQLATIVASANEEIDGWCGRQFNKDGGDTTRAYYASGLNAALPFSTVNAPRSLMVRGWTDLCFVDDFASITAVKTDENDDGVFEVTWTSSDYLAEPIGGIVDGVAGFAQSTLRAVGQVLLFPISGKEWTTRRRPSVQVTATFGWPAVPNRVHEAAVLIAIETFKLKDAPFGVAGFSEFGVVRVRDNPKIARLLSKYMKDAGGALQFA